MQKRDGHEIKNKGKKRRWRGRKGGGVGRSRSVEQHLWVALLIRYLQEVDGVAQGSLLQRQGEDQGELLR